RAARGRVAARAAPGGARCRARGPAVPNRPRVRARRHRLHPVDPACPLEPGGRARPVSGGLVVARAGFRAAGRHCRARAHSGAVSDLPQVVDADWLRARLGEPDLVVGDVRGPNAHARGHIAGSRPLVLGSPPPMSDPEVIEELAKEIGLRLRRHGVTGEERLVLYDRGDGVGAMPSSQLAELAGHPRVAVLLGGIAAWPDELEVGAVELEPVKVRLEPRLEALPTRAEVERRLGEEGFA